MRHIPKIIHYCWFGLGPMGKLEKRCLESWKLYFPDYEIIRWDEDRFDITKANMYVKEAYRLKKYAFVSDYVRLVALSDYGGIYFDTDVEVLKSFDVLLENEKMVLGRELKDSILTGMVACMPNFHIINRLINEYKDRKFELYDEQGKLLSTVTNPILFTKLLKQHGLEDEDKYQIVNNDISIYPIEYFCAFDLKNDHRKITSSTYTIHHYSSSWLPLKNKIIIKLKRVMVRMLGAKTYEKLKRIKTGR